MTRLLTALVAAALVAPNIANAQTAPADGPSPRLADGAVVPCRAGQYNRRAAHYATQTGEWTRIDLYLGPEEQWDYESVRDDCVAQADAHGRVLATLLDIGSDDQPDPPNIARYAAGIERLARRYRNQVDAWEVWNEPNHPLFGAGMTAESYGELLRASYAAVKRGDPGALVVAAGTSSVDLAFLGRVLATRPPFDALAVHPYEAPVDAAPGTTPVGLAALPELRWLMLRYDRREPVWVTEYGWPDGGFLEQAQAQFTACEYVAVAFVYDWSWH